MAKCMNSMKSLRKVATFSCRNTIRTEEDNCFELAAAQPATGNYIDVASDNRPPTQTAFFNRLSIPRSSQKKEEFSITVENQISTRLYEIAPTLCNNSVAFIGAVLDLQTATNLVELRIDIDWSWFAFHCFHRRRRARTTDDHYPLLL